MYGPARATSAASSPAGTRTSQLHMNQMLVKLVEFKGSDLHLTAGLPPMIRVDGALLPMEGFEVMTPSKVRDLVYEILSQRIRERFETNLELDTSHVVPGVGRFRLNVFQQRDSVGAVFRAIPFEIMSLGQLGVPRRCASSPTCRVVSCCSPAQLARANRRPWPP